MLRRPHLPASEFEPLETRRLLAAPALDALPAYTFPANKPVQVPLSTTYDGADSVIYTIKASNRSIVATIHPSTNTFVQLNVAGYSDPMVFELFNDLAPNTVKHFTGLVNAGFYNGLTFHRVAKNFVIQGGDPLGNGTGGADHPFDDEYNVNALFTGSGQLGESSSGPDSNGSQFFITEGPQRLLDFNHTIFGQLVRGEDTRLAISNVDIDANEKPLSPITITSAAVIQDTTDAVLQVKALSATTPTVLRITATTVQGSSVRSLMVTPSADTINDPPILGPIPAVYHIAENTSLNTQLTSIDLEGDPVHWAGLRVKSSGLDDASIDNGHLVVTPIANFTGEIQLLIGVAALNAHQSRGSIQFDDSLPLGGIYDTQLVTVAVGDAPIKATAYPLDAIGGATSANAYVASFRNGDAMKTASSFKASIDWGDGTVTAGTVVASSRRGVYSVLGSKTYAAGASGSLPLSVTISDDGGAVATATAAAVVRHSAAVAAGVLNVYGTSANDRIGINRKGAYYAVTVNGQTTAIAIGDVTKLCVYGFGGRDVINVNANVLTAAYIDAGDGDDTVYGGGGPEVINAGAGNDYVLTGQGPNRVAGGDGNDTIIGGASRDRLYGGNGNDSIIGGPGRDILSGDAGDDILIGGTSNDTLYGGEGDDTLNGLGGADIIHGDAGTDTAKRDPLDTYISVEHLV